MTETRLVKYGDQTMPVPEGTTVEQLRELMARHFPELADPQVETQKKGDKTTYVFSKKAGQKGGDGMDPEEAGRLANRLEALKADPVMEPAAALAMALWRGDEVGAHAATKLGAHKTEVVAQNLIDEERRVEEIVLGLRHLPSAQRPTGSIL